MLNWSNTAIFTHMGDFSPAVLSFSHWQLKSFMLYLVFFLFQCILCVSMSRVSSLSSAQYPTLHVYLYTFFFLLLWIGIFSSHNKEKQEILIVDKKTGLIKRANTVQCLEGLLVSYFLFAVVGVAGGFVSSTLDRSESCPPPWLVGVGGGGGSVGAVSTGGSYWVPTDGLRSCWAGS